MAERRPVTTADLLRFRPLSDPRISPDGARVAYVVTTHDREEDRSQTAIWMVPMAGGEPIRFTNPPEGCRDWAPRWSPDGRRLAFLSDRSKKPQIWIIDAAGGEAWCLTTREAVSSPPLWSPDGTLIAFTAPVFVHGEDWTPYPGAPAGDRARAEAAANADPSGPKKGKGAPSDVKVISHTFFRLRDMGYGGDRYSQLFVVPVAGGAVRQLTREARRFTQPAWAPDGKALYCVAPQSSDPTPAAFEACDVVKVDLVSGEVSRFFRSPFPLALPAPSPDGRFLAALGFADAQAVVGSNPDVLLWRLDAPAQAPVNLTIALDRSARPSFLASDVDGFTLVGPQWSADSDAVYSLIADQGAAHLYQFAVDGTDCGRVTGGDERHVHTFNVGVRGDMACLIGTPVSPAELRVLKDGDERALTDHNGFHRELDLQKAERFTFSGADGWPVTGWIMKPSGYQPGRRYPTYLDVHGGPMASWGNGLRISHQALAAAGIAVVVIDPRGSQGYGRAYSAAVVQDMGGKDYLDLMLGVDAVIAMGIADPDRLAIGGWSYGGYLSAWTVTQTDRFKAAFIGASLTNLLSMYGTGDVPDMLARLSGGDSWSAEGVERLLSRSPVRFAERVTTPCLILCVEGDVRTPISQSDEFYVALRMIGKAPAYQIRYPGEYLHYPVRPRHVEDLLERNVAWVRHWLKV